MTASGGPPPEGPPPAAPPYGYPPGPPVVEQTIMPVVGGILILVGALLGIATGAMFMVGTAWLMPIDIGISGILFICGIVYVLISIVALLGGIMAMQRKAFGFAVISGILSMLFGGFIFGLIGLILVAISRKEFQ